MHSSIIIITWFSANFEDRVGGAGVARWRTWLTGEGEKVRLKEPIEGECLMLNGMEFQTVGAAYLKALRPTVT